MGESGKQSILAEEFISNFSSKKFIICGRIEKLSSGTPAEINDELTSISSEIQKLSKTLHDSIIFLPSYSVKFVILKVGHREKVVFSFNSLENLSTFTKEKATSHYKFTVRQNEIRDVEKLLKEKEELLVPKKKFGFKSKLKPKVADENQTISMVKDGHKAIQVENEKMDANFCTIEDLDCVTRTFEESQLNANDVLLRNLTGCTIYLNGSPSTLRLKNIENCKILCGPVHTSVFVDNCTTSTFFICCQQLRTHSSEKLDIYLRVSSRAIIEDCHNIRFGPYIWNHPKSSELHVKVGIDQNLERFDAVDDFNWLSAESKSPNWMLIPEEERIVDFE